MTSTRAKIYGEIPADQPIRAPISRRRKSLRHHFCDGIEAAVKAEPEAFANTKPRTMLGLIVHNLVRGAGTGRCDQVKLVMIILDEGERRRGVAEMSAECDEDSPENPAPKPLPQWDWNEDGAWDSSVRPDDAKACKEQEEARAEALRVDIGDKFRRALEAERINTERRVRMELEREGKTAVPQPAPAPSPFPGTLPAAPRDPHAGTIRIGGRIVEG